LEEVNNKLIKEDIAMLKKNVLKVENTPRVSVRITVGVLKNIYNKLKILKTF
jgi:hypothetical protein